MRKILALVPFLFLAFFIWNASRMMSGEVSSEASPSHFRQLHPKHRKKSEKSRKNPHWASPIRMSKDELLHSLLSPSSGSAALRQSLREERVVVGNLLRSERYRHYIEDVEVIGSHVSFHFVRDAPDPGAPRIQDRLVRVIVDTRPGVDQARVLQLARAFTGFREFGAPELKILPDPSKKTARLVYRLEVLAQDEDDGGTVFLDAHSGQLVAQLASVEGVGNTIAESQVFTAEKQGYYSQLERSSSNNANQPDEREDGCQLISIQDGSLLRLNPVSCEQERVRACQILPPAKWARNALPFRLNPDRCQIASVRDSSAQRAADNARKVLDYFQAAHGRRSYDDRGSPVLSVVHVGIGLEAARWYRKRRFIAYGDGDGGGAGDYTKAIDVAGHEFTHGVIDSTAQLLGLGESGALGESLADFFGKMAENEGDWRVGRELFIGRKAGSAIRDLAEPGLVAGVYFDADGGIREKKHPATRSEMALVSYPCTPGNDQCAIHFNATVPGHAWFLIHEALGKNKAEKLLYLALTHYMGELTSFQEAAEDVLQACAISLSIEDCERVKETFFSTKMALNQSI